MRNNFIVITILTALVLLGCTDQRSLFVATQPLLLAENDWYPARLKPQVATLMTYPNTSELSVIIMDNPNIKTIGLNEGSYDLLVINEFFFSEQETNFDHIYFKGTSRFYSFEAYAKEMLPALKFRAKANEVVIENPDTLATRSTADLSIEGKKQFHLKYRNGKNGFYVPNTHIEDTISFTPCRVTHTCRVFAHVKNIKALNGKGYVKGSLRGFAGSVFLARRLPSHTNVTHQFNLNHIKFDAESTTDGTIRADFSTFGPPLDLPDRTYELELNVRYPSGREVKILLDVTDQVKPQIERMNRERLENKAVFEDIIIRIKFELEPDQSGDWELGIEDWGTDVIIPIPINLNQ